MNKKRPLLVEFFIKNVIVYLKKSTVLSVLPRIYHIEAFFAFGPAKVKKRKEKCNCKLKSFLPKNNYFPNYSFDR